MRMNTKRRINKTRISSKGTTTTDLMPCIMGAIDAIWENTTPISNSTPTSDTEDTPNLNHHHQQQHQQQYHPKRCIQANNFANLSPNVQKILSNVPDEELNKNFSSEESLGFRRFGPGDRRSTYRCNAPRTSPEKNLSLHKSTESLEDIISPGVQKMLSNLPDVDLVNKNSSFLHQNSKIESTNGLRGSKSFSTSRCNSFQHQLKNGKDLSGSCSVGDNLSVIDTNSDKNVPKNGDENTSFSSKPLGSYLHTLPSGIASRTPVGRKNFGKYLQVPSESSVGTNSTTSSEVSRPVSLTSLGSCSSSSSGGPHQPGSAYLASAESLDSDPEPTGSQGSADSGIAEQPTMSPEQCVLQEVMDTETIYVADLGEVIEGYLKPWQTDPDCPLTDYLQDLFSNLEEIYTFNRSFLKELQQANCDPILTANAFLHNNSGFSVYSEYCTHYPRTMTVLCELTGDEKMAGLFRERQVALGHALPLGSYLLKPVQRILKYHLLLQRLSKQCAQSHKSTVDLALATMTSVASHINTMKRKHEHAVRVQEIQSQLYGWTGPDLTALGELIAEGTFRVGGARGRRHIFLFDKVLLIAKSRQDGSLAYKSHIMCSNLMLLEQVRGEPLSFHILPFDNPRQQCTLRARSPQHKREWTLQIKRAILENYSAVIPNHAMQLVMQLGQNVQEEDASDKWTLLKQYSTPQYLERRSRVRKSRDLSGNRRTTSQDRSFPSLTNWRRKSEPGIVNQYTTKTLPKRITKIKKAKDHQTAKFYTDLSDSENCDGNGELKDEAIEVKAEDVIHEEEHESHIASTTLEKVVSDLLMQNEEFHKILNRQRRNIRDSEPVGWTKGEADDLPSKADSLPRDFQLNDQLECKETSRGDADDGDVVKPNTRDDSLLNTCKQPDVEVEDLQENDLSSQLNDSEHPDHRIYRKSAIRFSLVQRVRAIISQEQRHIGKLPTYMQGSESMGAKIAHPDYADPQKLFRSSRSDLSINSCQNSENSAEECRRLGVVINEEVVSLVGLQQHHSLEDIEENGSSSTKSSQGINKSDDDEGGGGGGGDKESIFNSSQNSDSYYERLLEKNLNEESNDNNYCVTQRSSSVKILKVKVEGEQDIKEESKMIERKVIKRPTKAPPPIPIKPPRLLNATKENIEHFPKKINVGNNEPRASCDQRKVFVSNENKLNNSKGWVKTIVGRFE